ncbi:uncharacterized protein SCDLUD_000873 [Saccharomycodes ludwigii]|uniref:uncharacterized protein n=1 Tax=Saccharomycodes ludwigii TaxID=36035 RepID=UPI001E83820C|nr:hypothetical protein SCDLUD_000873 [Saccharomycodes ludwigii]KAH3903252.1 hypothetical protein SCDLUD_000873 [Saccharomycodes ludwigii]
MPPLSPKRNNKTSDSQDFEIKKNSLKKLRCSTAKNNNDNAIEALVINYDDYNLIVNSSDNRVKEILKDVFNSINSTVNRLSNYLTTKLSTVDNSDTTSSADGKGHTSKDKDLVAQMKLLLGAPDDHVTNFVDINNNNNNIEFTNGLSTTNTDINNDNFIIFSLIWFIIILSSVFVILSLIFIILYMFKNDDELECKYNKLMSEESVYYYDEEDEDEDEDGEDDEYEDYVDEYL